MSKKILEGDIEEYLKKRIKLYGGMCFKLTSPSNAGMPDRLVVHKGKVFFVELKAPGKKPRPLQQAQIKSLRLHGAKVEVIDSYLGVDIFCKKLKEVTCEV